MAKNKGTGTRNNIVLVDKYKDTGEYLNIINNKYIKIDYKADDTVDPDLQKSITEISIKKRAFINKLDTSVSYVNYFIEHFDEDMSLLGIYFTLMYSIMTKEVDLPMDHFIDFIETFFSEQGMIDKIIAMVDHNTDETMIKKKKLALKDQMQLLIHQYRAQHQSVG